MTSKMDLAAQNLEFEKAAALRDQITELEKLQPKKPGTGIATRGRGKTKGRSAFRRR
jgi:hypothetical protein